jgi:hypothetical protein
MKCALVVVLVASCTFTPLGHILACNKKILACDFPRWSAAKLQQVLYKIHLRHAR